MLKKYGARGRLTGRTAAVVHGCGGVLHLVGFLLLLNNQGQRSPSGIFAQGTGSILCLFALLNLR